MRADKNKLKKISFIKRLVFRLSFIISFPIIVSGEVNLRKGSYKFQVKKQFVSDTSLMELEQLEKLELTYNSRSLFLGKFGFGWCSNLDHSLEYSPSGIRIYKCNKLVFLHVNNQLTRSTTLSEGIERVVSYPKGIRYIDKRGNLYDFGKDGQLEGLSLKNNSGNQEKLLFYLDPVGFLRKVGSYKVSVGEGGNLDALTIRGKGLRMHYDSYGNLMSAFSKGKRLLENRYQLDFDRITYHMDSDGCEHRYKYDKKNQPPYYTQVLRYHNSCESLKSKIIYIKSKKTSKGRYKLHSVEVESVKKPFGIF